MCPGLFGIPDLAPGAIPPIPALDRLLARADREEVPGRDPLETLATAFGVGAPPGGDLPSGVLSLFALAPDLAATGCWFHADPVHLRADRDQLLLFGGPDLGVTGAESAALVVAFNAHFGVDGLELVAPQPGHWYLRVPWAQDLQTQPLHRVSGRPLVAFPPQGSDARVLNQWQNETQMLFYQHPVNLAREDSGRPTISGVWSWGGGVLPQVQRGPDLTVADHPLAAGLAAARGAPVLGLGDLYQLPSVFSGSAPSSVLIFWDRLWWPALALDAQGWAAALVELEGLVARLCAALAAGPVGCITLDDGEHRCFTLTRWRQRRFWRRGRGLRGF